MSTPKSTFDALESLVPLHEQFDDVEVEEAVVEPKREIKVKDEVQPVPKGHGGCFVKRGGKLYPRGS